ncbi:MAG: hypothetical protein IPI73_02630 [Betaproteobacteria bacterium]|nr:hypothetical protein [Betaproteobacteria bacterium]
MFTDFAAIKASVSFADVINKLGLQPSKLGINGAEHALLQIRGRSRTRCDRRQRVLLRRKERRRPDNARGPRPRPQVKEAAEWLAGTVPVPVPVPNSTVPRNSTSPGTVPESERGEETKKLQPLSYLQAEQEGVQALGVSKETLEQFQAGFAPRGILRGRLAIPLRNNTGSLVAHVGRALGDEQPKLLFPRDFNPASVIFNGDKVDRGDFTYITDDPLQVLIAQQNGVPNVVAVLTDMNSEVLSVLAVWMDEHGVVSIKPF